MTPMAELDRLIAAMPPERRGPGRKPGGQNSYRYSLRRKPRCIRGHRFTKANIIWKEKHVKGRVYLTRHCRECARMHWRNWALQHQQTYRVTARTRAELLEFFASVQRAELEYVKERVS